MTVKDSTKISKYHDWMNESRWQTVYNQKYRVARQFLPKSGSTSANQRTSQDFPYTRLITPLYQTPFPL